MKHEWTLLVRLDTLTAAAQLPSAMDQFRQVMERHDKDGHGRHLVG